LVTVNVQWKGVPTTTLPAASFALVRLSSGSCSATVSLSVFEVIPPATTEAKFVTVPAVTSAAVTV
jgi:hypothetical protein